MKKRRKKHFFKNIVISLFGIGVFFAGALIIWASLLKLPDFKLFTEQKIKSSTKIYDRTGTNLLYNVHEDIKRTVVKSEDIGVNVKNATIAIEDSEFYQHKGIRISSIIRGTIWAKITGRKIQGGSTITQQLIKNALLTSDRTIARKIKEWILAVKIERIMNKEEILTLYFNEAPYGGNIYGVEEASLNFFGIHSRETDIAQAAYLAAIPNAPTHFSPYGKYKNELDSRKNLVLKRMLDLKFITNEEYNQAKGETVVFQKQLPNHIQAPHFVFYIKDYLEKKYGDDVIENGGLKIITTLDYDLQKKAEEVALNQSKINESLYSGKNVAIVAIDPKTGAILSMVGSRSYFDKEIDGNFNVATAPRQPGSSFKPIVYALAFEKGYTENTTLFDVKTEFNASCLPSANEPKPCYSPDNFDNNFRGPLTLRSALAESRNVVAVKMLYLVGVKNAITFAHDLGITTLNDEERYGLSLVIGGGETTLLDMTSAYSVFANEGIRHPSNGILSVTDDSGKVLEEYKEKSYQVVGANSTRILSSILSDDIARAPTFHEHSKLEIPGHQVAVKTGTTNDSKDGWMIGYTPSVAIGVWTGNNENTPMKKGASGGSTAGPVWNQIMTYALAKLPNENFVQQDPIDPKLPPILRGFWQGSETYVVDNISGALATELTPEENKKEISITNVHSILHWINKDNPIELKSTFGSGDSQYNNWEYGIQIWWQKNKEKYTINTIENKPTVYDTSHTYEAKPVLSIVGLKDTVYKKNDTLSFEISVASKNPINKIDVFVNKIYITSLKSYPFKVDLNLIKTEGIQNYNNINIIAYDKLGNVGENTTPFSVE